MVVGSDATTSPPFSNPHHSPGVDADGDVLEVAGVHPDRCAWDGERRPVVPVQEGVLELVHRPQPFVGAYIGERNKHGRVVA